MCLKKKSTPNGEGAEEDMQLEHPSLAGLEDIELMEGKTILTVH